MGDILELHVFHQQVYTVNIPNLRNKNSLIGKFCTYSYLTEQNCKFIFQQIGHCGVSLLSTKRH